MVKKPSQHAYQALACDLEQEAPWLLQLLRCHRELCEFAQILSPRDENSQEMVKPAESKEEL